MEFLDKLDSEAEARRLWTEGVLAEYNDMRVDRRAAAIARELIQRQIFPTDEAITLAMWGKRTRLGDMHSTLKNDVLKRLGVELVKGVRR